MTHGENLHVLIFEEDADTAESLANLLGESGHPLQLAHVSEAGKLGTALKAIVPDILICSTRQTSAAFETTQSLLAGRNPEFPVITVTDIHPEGNMAVANLAGPAQLVAYNRPDWINLRLDHYRLVSDGIIFEIPELVAASDLKNAIIFARSMERIHCKVALEHYGRSNQPQLLNHLPVDFLKIDGNLTNNLAAKEENQTPVKGVASLAHKHGKKCIAEHVEEAGDLALLWQYGVDFIQGNFVQEPSRHLSYDFEGEIA